MKVKSVFGTGGPILDGGKGGRLLQKKTTIMVWSGNFAMLWIDNYHCSLGTSNLTFWGERTEPEHLFFSKQKLDN